MFSSSARVARDFVEVPKCYGIVNLMRLSGEVGQSCVLFGQHFPPPPFANGHLLSDFFSDGMGWSLVLLVSFGCLKLAGNSQRFFYEK